MSKLERMIITVAFVGGFTVTAFYLLYVGYNLFGGLILSQNT